MLVPRILVPMGAGPGVVPSTTKTQWGRSQVSVPRVHSPVDAKVAVVASPSYASQGALKPPAVLRPRESQKTVPAPRSELLAEVMLEKSRTKPRKLTADFLTSLTLHAILLGALLAAPLYWVDAIDLPRFNRALLVGPPPAPAPPPARLLGKTLAAPRRILSVAGKLVAPTMIPKRIAQLIEETPGADSLAGLGLGANAIGGTPGGQVGGVIGGLPSGTSRTAIPPAPPASVPAGPLRVGGDVKEPRLISRVEPVYPPLAVHAKVAGDVAIDAVIDAQGNVVEMQVVSGHPLLIAAAKDALRKWKYEPTRVAGQAVPVRLFVHIIFLLS